MPSPFFVGSNTITARPPALRNVPHDSQKVQVCSFPQSIADFLKEKSFKPHQLFTNGHAQTILGYAWPRFLTPAAVETHEDRLFQVEPGVHILARCQWQPEPVNHSTLVLVHGLEGSSESKYLLGTALKAFSSGFNVVRINMRNCGGTEHLAPTLYHSGRRLTSAPSYNFLRTRHPAQ